MANVLLFFQIAALLYRIQCFGSVCGVVAVVAGCSTQDHTGSVKGKLQQGVFMNFCLTCKRALHNPMSIKVPILLALNIGNSAQEAEAINQLVECWR